MKMKIRYTSANAFRLSGSLYSNPDIYRRALRLGNCQLRGILPFLAFALILGLRSAASAGPTHEDLRLAEEIALHFVNGRIVKVDSYLSTPLKERLGPEAIKAAQLRMETTSGKLRQVQAAYALPDDGPATQAAIPIDYEHGATDLVLAWRGPLVEASLVDFRLRPQQPRPAPVARRTAATMAFPDASYVDPKAFTERPLTFSAPNGPELLGYLALPNSASDKPVPLVVLLPDLAMEGADGAIGPNRILRDVALGLATRGIATFRFEPRPGGATVNEVLLADATAAVRAAANRTGINPLEVHIVAFGSGGSFALGLLQQKSPLRGLAIIAAPPVYDLPFHARRLEAEGSIAERDRPALQGDLELFEKGHLSLTQLIAGRPASFWQSADRVGGPSRAALFRGKLLYVQPEFEYLANNPDAWAQLCRSPLRRFVALKGTNRWLLASTRGGHPDEFKMPGHVTLEALETIEQFVRWDPTRK